ncbi:tetratricopeptide repeat-containing glycosyltransferase family 2 protein [Bacillus cereus]|uniref:tetratricopeptide repeat-containing glycosyltransferase family 2 protein n=1 Tax=Bacillus cereus TaxID=1396 RepID=UPI001482E03F|nr:glycosyltransferase [Bacillus cereus]
MITISLCMIIKNEEDTLARCLESVKGIPDEIILIDTGSTDNTIHIAKQWTNNVYHLKWRDNFADARNYSFQKATKDYILWLDADDVLQSTDYQKLVTLKQTLDPSVDMVSMVYHVFFDEYDNIATSTKRYRLLKRKHNFQWHGRVHEDIVRPENMNCYDADIAIVHKKIKSSIVSVKRNLSIFENILNEGRELTPNEMLNFAKDLHSINQYEKAIVWYEKYLSYQNIPRSHQIFAYQGLAHCYDLIGNAERAIELILQTLQYSLPQPFSCCRLGEYFFIKKQFRYAIFWYESATKFTDVHSFLLDQSAYRTWIPHQQLGICYYELKDYDKAIKHFQHVLEYKSNHPEIIDSIETIHKEIEMYTLK